MKNKENGIKMIGKLLAGVVVLLLAAGTKPLTLDVRAAEITGESRAAGEVQTGSVNCITEGSVTWSYDPETGETVVTGSGTRVLPTGWHDEGSFPRETESIRFENCEIKGVCVSLFYGLDKLKTIDFTGLKTGSVTSMNQMFYTCSSLTSLDVSNFDTSSVIYMNDMFHGCSGLTSLDLSNFDTSSVTHMINMFHGCSGLTSLDLSNFDTSSVTDMLNMFYGCSGLTSLDLSNFDTSSVTDMFSMFYGCSGLTSLDLSNFDTSSVTNMGVMFFNCRSLTSLNLSNFDFSSVKGDPVMFVNCTNLTSINAPKQMGECSLTLPDTFADPEGNRTTELTAAYAGKLLKRVIPFTDVPSDAWYYNAVEAVYNKGYMSGKGDGSFSPAGLLTRGEIATVLYNMSERPDTAYEEHFGDIPSGQWYSAPVTWVYQNNIAAGYGNGDFGVADRLTREQLAVMLYQYARHQNNNLAYDDNALTRFPDAGQVSSWAETAMKWAVSRQIINGTGDGYLKPDGNATRAECASVINGFTEKVK